MSDHSTPPPGFWRQQPQHRQTNYANHAYSQHQPLPHPSTVPPPLYGYNPGSHYSHPPQNRRGNMPQYHSQNQHSERPPALDSPWECQACQISLDSESALRAHTEAHITCSQCSFTASRKVVNGHYQSAHGKFAGGGFKTVTVAVPGCRVQRFNICVGNHPDDVKKWIQERKKRFPRQQKKKDDTVEKKKDKEEPTRESTLGSLLDGYGSSSSEEDNDGKPVTSQSVETAKQENNLEQNEASTAASPETNTDSPVSRPPNYRTRPCKYFLRNGSCRNGDNCNFSHEIQNNPQPRERCSPRAKRQRRSSSSTTLLRKLLENDARREAILSLQLLEYLVDCNYLQQQRQSGEKKNSDP